MLTLVLNLRHRADRRDAMLEKLQPLGLTPTFIEAINGSAPEHAGMIEQTVTRTGLNPNEVGCYLSHVKAWRSLLASDSADALILEDDALLDPILPEILILLQQHASKLHVVRLSALCKIVGRHVYHLTPQHSLIYTTKNPSGAQGYYLTRAGAAMLVQHMTDIASAIDTELDRYWQWGGEILTLNPSVLHHDQSSASDIGGQMRAPSRRASPRWDQRVLASLNKHWLTACLRASHPLFWQEMKQFISAGRSRDH